ncbi:MAG: shikimate dehydrogenase [Cyclobacteriaceae bacterium]
MEKNKVFGLIGYPLSHSFSKGYFTEKFQKSGLTDHRYDNFEIDDISKFTDIISTHGKELIGMNVTIPYKQEVIPFLDSLDSSAERIGAVNVIKKMPDNSYRGYNSDYLGFKESLKLQLNGDLDLKALVLGTGGASKAVQIALEDLEIDYQLVSRIRKETSISYQDIDYQKIQSSRLLINTTPLGMSPNTSECPDIPYEGITTRHYLYDLVYNPEETLFLSKGKEKGSSIKNGLDMLHLQAEEAWGIWNNKSN